MFRFMTDEEKRLRARLDQEIRKCHTNVVIVFACSNINIWKKFIQNLLRYMTFDLVFLHILYLRFKKKTFSFFLVLWDIVRSLFVSFAINWGHIEGNWQEPLLPEDGGREAEAATCQLTEPRRSLRSLCSGWTVPACCACLKSWF